ncbi:hypothetical protein GI374_01250 [Paracoccus sp. S-4012]|uniref:hypothetical protein n=1 Tax=Paracoccus sp. S-4012 TaxID=2665648 RepID=UPI0012B08F50|nr:hypothetical protein [Paracoccus sp. S-4012]MRX49084.1 hypothetical protein [Paracoccus sp. S-4012]
MSHSDSPLTAPAPGAASASDPIDRRQETYRPSPYPPRGVPPSGDVSPDGTRPWPRTSLTSKVLVYGGIGIAAAAATAGAVLAVRAVVDAISGDDDDEDRVEEARERARRRQRSRMPRNAYAPRGRTPRYAVGGFNEPEEDQERFERARSAPRRRPPPQRPMGAGLLDDVNHTVADMTDGVRNLLDTVNAAVKGFQSVAGQAGGIMDEFHNAADTVRSMLDTAAPDRQRRPRPATARPSRRDVVDLRDETEAEHRADTRTHNL